MGQVTPPPWGGMDKGGGGGWTGGGVRVGGGTCGDRSGDITVGETWCRRCIDKCSVVEWSGVRLGVSTSNPTSNPHQQPGVPICMGSLEEPFSGSNALYPGGIRSRDLASGRTPVAWGPAPALAQTRAKAASGGAAPGVGGGKCEGTVVTAVVGGQVCKTAAKPGGAAAAGVGFESWLRDAGPPESFTAQWTGRMGL